MSLTTVAILLHRCAGEDKMIAGMTYSNSLSIAKVKTMMRYTPPYRYVQGAFFVS